MSDAHAPRLVALPDGRPLDILPPSWELSEALCDLTETSLPGEPWEKALTVMNTVVTHCVDISDISTAGIVNTRADDLRPYVGGPCRWPEIVRAIVATWPNSGPWSHWRAFVRVCVAVYVENTQPPLWTLDPEKLRQSEEADGTHEADTWLNSANPSALSASALATPTSTPTKPPRRRGRPKTAASQKDCRIEQAWESGQYENLVDLANAFGMTVKAVNAARGRVRWHRRKPE